jgi:hypothetical protein
MKEAEKIEDSDDRAARIKKLREEKKARLKAM